MYDGVKAMIAEEKKLAAADGAGAASSSPAGKEVEAGSHLKKIEDITGFVKFPAGTKSLLSKYMTKEVFDKYHGKKDKAGVSFEQMVLSGC